jgi:hypothetical protein
MHYLMFFDFLKFIGHLCNQKKVVQGRVQTRPYGIRSLPKGRL